MMTLLEILALAHDCGVSLRLAENRERILAMPSVNITPELGDAIRANKPALLAIVSSWSWPWLGQVGFVQAEAHCACCVQVEYEGKIRYLPVHAFTRLGEPLCVGCVAKRIGGADLETL